MKTKLSIRKRAPRRELPGDLSHARGGGARLAVTAIAGTAFVLMLLSSATAQELQVRDLVEIEGAGPNYLRGVGLVVGLNGTGDGDKGETLTMLKNIVANDLRRPVGEMSSKNVALVTVTAVLPPFAKPGTKIDVRVQASNGAKSIAGGTLFITPLRSPRATGEDPTVFAVAQGPVIVEGDARAGNPNAGVVQQGGIIETGIRQEIVSQQIWELSMPERVDGGWAWKAYERRRMPTIVLNLRKPDIDLAAALASKINTYFRELPVQSGFPTDTGPERDMTEAHLARNPLARAVDGGRIFVRLPGSAEFRDLGIGDQDQRFELEPTRFATVVLQIGSVSQPAKARVVINDATKTIAIVGNVGVKRGYVMFDGGEVPIPSNMPLTDLMQQATLVAALTAQKRIDLIRALNDNGMIDGIVESQ